MEERRGQAQRLAPFVPKAQESLGRTACPGGTVLGIFSGLGIRWYLKAERDAENHAFALAESASGKSFRYTTPGECGIGIRDGGPGPASLGTASLPSPILSACEVVVTPHWQYFGF